MLGTDRPGNRMAQGFFRASSRMGGGRDFSRRSRQIAQRVMLAAIVLCCWTGYAAAVGAPDNLAPHSKIKIAVFPFELEDFSAAHQEGTSPIETRYLADSTKEAKQALLQSGRYSVIDTGAAETHAPQNCKGCDAAVAKKLGADQAMVGFITKVSMTEYVVRLQVIDARSGKVTSGFTTDLRMGADYSWSRGVRWLMKNRMLASK
ncbi:MAG: DUF3280 domain-containing protein [Methylovirgula sp.]